MSDRKYDRALLAHKVAWEGGIISTLEYGIRADDISDPELAAAWAEMQRLYDELRPLLTTVDELLQHSRRAARLAAATGEPE